MRRLFAVFALSLILVGLLARADHHATIEARLVVAAGGSSFPTREGTSLRLGPAVVPAFVVTRIASADREVLLTLAPPTAQALADVTAAHVGERLAVVVDGVVQSAPVIRGAIRGGGVSITLRSAADATALARALAR